MKSFSVGFKLILFIIIAVFLYKELYVNGVFTVGALYYFTIQSNILVEISLLLLLMIPRDNKSRCFIRGITLFAISLTGIVYNFVLYKIFLDWGTVGYAISRIITHIVAPIGFILDWLLFDKHNMMKWKHIFIWIIYPILYCSISFYVGLRHGSSIYFFFNISDSYASALKWISILSCISFAIGLLYIGLDKYLGRKENFA